MKKFIKKILSMILVTAITISMTAFTSENSVSASGTTDEFIDSLLRKANTPENEIEQMDDEFKRFIYENSLSKGNVEYINVTQEQGTGIMTRAAGYTIPTSELKLSVIAFKYPNKNQVDIYPSYEWLVPTKPKGKDYFGYSTHSSFSVVPGERNNLIWYKIHSNDNWVRSHEASYTGSSLTGYEHSGSDLGTPDFPIYLKGHFHYRVDIDSSSPVKKIVLAYVHDTSWGGGISYGVSYGPLSISITPSSSSVGYQNNVYYFNY